MATIIHRIPGVSTNTSLRKFYVDSRMNKGSLYLIDFSHPDCSLTGVPVNNSTINNIAWKNAQKMILSGNQTTLSSTVKNTIIDSTKGKIEITSKKGLHGIISQQNDVIGEGNDFQIIIPSLIRDYIFNNISRGFFVSIWDKKTRLALTSTSAFFVLNLQNTGNFIAAFQTGGSNSIGTNLGVRGSGNLELNSLLPQVVNLAFSQKTGNTTNDSESAFKFGSGFAYGGFEQNKACSQILYQIHIVDLTTAGLTYAQADALDLASFNSAFAVGGRFAGDTFTNPTTLP